MSSVVGRLAIPFGGVYASSKWALEALAETSSYELAPFGVDVAIVQPGAYDTNIGNSRIGPDDVAREGAYGEVTPLAANVSGALTRGRGARPGRGRRAIFALAGQPAGTRPLRTPVPHDPAVAAINDAVAPIQRAVIESFGLSELLPKARHSREREAFLAVYALGARRVVRRCGHRSKKPAGAVLSAVTSA